MPLAPPTHGHVRPNYNQSLTNEGLPQPPPTTPSSNPQSLNPKSEHYRHASRLVDKRQGPGGPEVEIDTPKFPHPTTITTELGSSNEKRTDDISKKGRERVVDDGVAKTLDGGFGKNSGGETIGGGGEKPVREVGSGGGGLQRAFVERQKKMGAWAMYGSRLEGPE